MKEVNVGAHIQQDDRVEERREMRDVAVMSFIWMYEVRPDSNHLFYKLDDPVCR